MKISVVMDITIEKGIPIPYMRGTYGLVWDKMENGDSFVVPNERHRNAAIGIAKRAGHVVTSEKTNGTGYRVWLVTKAHNVPDQRPGESPKTL